MLINVPRFKSFRKSFSVCLTVILTVFVLSGCSTNPATGAKQFTALMSPQQELQIGAEQHREIAKLYNIQETGYPLQDYVQRIGQKVSKDTERPDITYKFYVLDSPDVNAFALPGGYVYVTRGLVAYANSEAELAAVLGHEVAHITARHSAERYSRGVLTSLGAAVISAALDAPDASRALGIGSELYIKSYSRGQEHEADDLGIRYLSRAGYDPLAMSRFLSNLNAHTALENKLAGRGKSSTVESYFSTHPQTADRINQTITKAGNYPIGSDRINRDAYLNAIDGMIYGESPREGFVRGRDFIHTDLGFRFRVPENFKISNQKRQIVAKHPNGAVILVDLAKKDTNVDSYSYLRQIWMRGETLDNPERISINGLNASTASFPGQIDGRAVTIRLVAIEWAADQVFRFQIAIPRGSSGKIVEGLKEFTYSFIALSSAEKKSIKPYRIRIITAVKGDSVASISARMPDVGFRQERFRVLNSLKSNENVQAGQRYKIISEI